MPPSFPFSDVLRITISCIVASCRICGIVPTESKKSFRVVCKAISESTYITEDDFILRWSRDAKNLFLYLLVVINLLVMCCLRMSHRSLTLLHNFFPLELTPHHAAVAANSRFCPYVTELHGMCFELLITSKWHVTCRREAYNKSELQQIKLKISSRWMTTPLICL